MPDDDGAVTHATTLRTRAFEAGRHLRRGLPPARLVWASLLVLGGYSLIYLDGVGFVSLVGIPVVAVGVDLVFQRVRFDRLRFPDAALATGLFVALVLPPSAPVAYTAVGAFAAVAGRHVLRYAGRPLFNPAATGVLLAAFGFGLVPAWWAGIGPFGIYLVVGLGVGLVLRSPAGWRLPTTFLLTYGAFATLQHVVLGATTDLGVLWLQATDPTTIFFGLFMVAEPRTAPSAPAAQPLYAGTVGTTSAFAPIFSPAAGLLLALLVGNLVAVVLRRSDRTVTLATRRSGRLQPPGSHRVPRAVASRWSAPRRAGAGVLVGVVLLAVVATAPAQHGTPILVANLPAGGAAPGSGCASDNSSIPSSTLQSLHHLLGPSVILSYDSARNIVVFYDPVNHVTVTETDLNEDYGFAEFNGDDYAVSGCAA